MEVEHFSHQHPLIFKEDSNGEEVVCFGCEEELISGPYYGCPSCNFFLHKKCAELPQEIDCNFHSEHPLLLKANRPSPFIKRCCDICDKACKRFVYQCALCQFVLDINCAFPPCLFDVDDSQGHQFKRLISSVPLKSFSFTCNACGNDGDASPFMCTMCLLMVHRECISLPHTVKSHMHNHPQIKHSYSLRQSGSVKKYCGICRVEVRAGFGGYYCPHCKFVAHVSCALHSRAYELENKKEEEPSTTVNSEVIELVAYSVREIKQGMDIIIAEIKHCSHQHNLVLVDDVVVNHDLKCYGCLFPISSPYYSCPDCNFFLDESCIKLPRKKTVNNHLYPLAFISRAQTSDGVFFCVICERHSQGFSYRCDKYNINIDVRCINAMEDFIEHEGHEHPLSFSSGVKNYHCSACRVTRSSSSSLRCTHCGFSLDIKCATLPNKVWHKYDDHSLLLTYVDPNTYQFYCQICEKERDPKLWFYRCEECDFDAHIECILGENPYIKFGDTYTYSFHSHPLALVENVEGDPPACHTCLKPCNDIALECADSQCNFAIHRRL